VVGIGVSSRVQYTRGLHERQQRRVAVAGRCEQRLHRQAVRTCPDHYDAHGPARPVWVSIRAGIGHFGRLFDQGTPVEGHVPGGINRSHRDVDNGLPPNTHSDNASMCGLHIGVR
jgi:hypothetical protein